MSLLIDPPPTRQIVKEPGSRLGSVRDSRLAEGKRVGDCYVIKGRSANCGGMEGWLAEDEALGRDVCLFIVPEEIRSQALVQKLKAEIKRIRPLTHPNILRVYECLEADDVVAVVTDAFHGVTLADMCRAKSGPLEASELQPWIPSLCKTLEQAHRIRLVHGNLTLDNVIVDIPGKLLVAHFGISRMIRASMAGNGESLAEAVPSDDVCGVGMLCYEALSGKSPQAGNTAGQLPESLDPVWVQTLEACMAADPTMRPRSPGAIAEALKSSGTAIPVGPRRMIAPITLAPSLTGNVPVVSEHAAVKSVNDEGPGPDAHQPSADAKPASSPSFGAAVAAAAAARIGSGVRPPARALPITPVVVQESGLPGRGADNASPAPLGSPLASSAAASEPPSGDAAVLKPIAPSRGKTFGGPSSADPASPTPSAGPVLPTPPYVPERPRPLPAVIPAKSGLYTKTSAVSAHHAGNTPGPIPADSDMDLDSDFDTDFDELPSDSDGRSYAPSPMPRILAALVVLALIVALLVWGVRLLFKPTRVSSTNPAALTSGNAVTNAPEATSGAPGGTETEVPPVESTPAPVPESATEPRPAAVEMVKAPAENREIPQTTPGDESPAPTPASAGAETPIPTQLPPPSVPTVSPGADGSGEMRPADRVVAEVQVPVRIPSMEPATSQAPLEPIPSQPVPPNPADSKTEPVISQTPNVPSAVIEKKQQADELKKAAADVRAKREAALAEAAELKKKMAASAKANAKVFRDTEALALRRKKIAEDLKKSEAASEKAMQAVESARATLAKFDTDTGESLGARNAAEREAQELAARIAENEKAAKAAEQEAIEMQKQAERAAQAALEAEKELEETKRIELDAAKKSVIESQLRDDATVRLQKQIFIQEQEHKRRMRELESRLNAVKSGQELPGLPEENVAPAASNGEPSTPKKQLQPLKSSLKGFVNSLGIPLVPVGDLWFAAWPTRVRDFETFASAKGLTAAPWRYVDFPQTPSHPVVSVTWEEAKRFCEWLTQKERKSGKISRTQTYRLPTDEEWSLAVGLSDELGTTPDEKDMAVGDLYPWGTDWPPPAGAGNYVGEESGLDVCIKGYNDGYRWTSPVGAFEPGINGLHDMGGNVWQWCEDRWNPNSSRRVLRGGSWVHGAMKLSVLASARYSAEPNTRGDAFGFRIVLEPSGKVSRRTK